MTPHEQDPEWLVKEPIYFYYSRCYYNNNFERLYSRYQVGRGDTSWDIGISDLIYKGCPRLDLTMQYPTEEELDKLPADQQMMRDFKFEPQGWIKPLLQFRNYEGLDFRMVDAEGKDMDVFNDYVKDLKEHVRGTEIGPAVVPFFAGKPYGNGDDEYVRFMG
jgi:hypothetical protein